MRRSASKILNHIYINLVTSSMTYKMVHKPGGGLIGVMNNWTGQILESGEDPHGIGWWAYVRIARKSNKKITFIMVYQVCQ